MQKIIFFLLLIVISFNTYSQNSFSNKGELNVNEGTLVYIKGNLLNSVGGTIFNGGTLSITDSIINNSNDSLFYESYHECKGKVILNGTQPQVITGTNPVAFSRLILNNPASLKLETNICAKDSLFLQSGSIFLDGNNIMLEKQGDLGVIDTMAIIYGENETNRIYDTIQDPLLTGAIIVNGYKIDPGTVNVANTGFIIETSQIINSLVLYRRHNSLTNVADTSIFRNFEVLSTGVSGGEINSLKINYHDNEWTGLNTDESNFKIWRENNGTLEKLESTVDIVNNNVSTPGVISITPGIYTISSEICDVLPETEIGNDTTYVCEEDSIIINTAYNENYSYIWNSNQIDLTSLNYTGHSLAIPWDSLSGKNNIELTVLVTNELGCENHDTTTIVIKPKPVSGFSLNPQHACVGQDVQFNGPLGMNSYYWTYEGQNSNIDNFIYSFSTDAEHTVSLTVDSNGCFNTFSENIKIFPNPTADFIVNDACDNQEILFENTSMASGYGSPTLNQNIWNFGDTNTDTISENGNITHSYLSPGIYNAGLIVRTHHGCIDSVTKSITISPSVSVDFSTSSICFGETATFINSTLTIPGVIYNWDFGDGTTAQSDEFSPGASHYYNQSGTYNIRLVAETGSGCSDTLNKTIVVYPFGNADFSVAYICLNELSVFTNTSSALANSNYLWDFGDGNTSTNFSPTNLYANNGIYNVQLIVTTENACSDTIIKQHVVNELPQADFTVNDVCFGETSLFNNTSINNSGNTYYWDFGNGNTSTSNDLSPNTNTVYAIDGTYTVTLITENSYSCFDTIQYQTTIKELPIIPLNSTTYTCTGSIILDAENAGSTYFWSTGDNSQSITVSSDGLYTVTVTNPITTCVNEKTTEVVLNSNVVVDLGGNNSHCDSVSLNAGYFDTYNWSTGETSQLITILTSDEYIVTVTDINNCIGYDTVNITINYSPIVDLGNDITVCEGTYVILDAQNPGSLYSWNIGEAIQALSVVSSGNYWLTVTDINNCSTVSDTVSVQINNNPILPFTGETIFSCNSINLNAQNIGSDYLWNTGETSQIITTDQSGLYWIEITNPENCFSKDSIIVDMNLIDVVELGNDTILCDGDFITLNISDSSSVYTYLWNNNSTQQHLQVASTGEYWLTKYSTNGCISIDTIFVTINETPFFDLGEDLYLCSSFGMDLISPVYSEYYKWYSDNDTISQEHSVDITEPGNYWLELTNSYSCSFLDSITIKETPFLSTPQFLVDSDVKVGDTVKFISLTYPEPESYNWIFGDGVTSTSSDPTHTYYIEDTYNVIFEAVTGNCSASVSKQITVSNYKSSFQEMDTAFHYNEIIDFLYAKLYPNPNNGKFNIELELTQKTDIIIVMFDIQGKVIFQTKIRDEFYLYKQFDYSYLNSGIYFMKVLAGNKSETFKIAVSN